MLVVQLSHHRINVGHQPVKQWKSPICLYLVQLLMPPLLADELTMENHGGGAKTERLSYAALHKRLQVRVQLQWEGT